jgi:ATPase subunit of ABC transporter with duplicated ATPase domains
MNKLLDEQARLQDQIDAGGLWELDRKIEIAMDALRLPPPDERVEHLSGGEKRRVALCKVLLEEPDMLLLDEPTNHLDAESVAWLEHHLAAFKGTIVAITHDRYFLDNVAEWILELDRGEGIPWKGNYSSWLEQKQERLRQGGEAGVGPPAHPAARAGVGAHGAPGAPGQEQGPHRRVRGAAEPGPAREASTTPRSSSPPARGWARRWW